MKKLVYLLYVLLLLPTIVSCSNNKVSSSGDNISITTIEDASNIDVYLKAIVRQDFYLDNNHYIMNTESNLVIEDNYELIGYFVNEEDLNYWKTYDNNIDLKYAVDDSNNLVHNGTVEFKDRFAIYSIDNPNNLGLRIGSELCVYEIV